MATQTWNVNEIYSGTWQILCAGVQHGLATYIEDFLVIKDSNDVVIDCVTVPFDKVTDGLILAPFQKMEASAFYILVDENRYVRISRTEPLIEDGFEEWVTILRVVGSTVFEIDAENGSSTLVDE